jgi:hypothetical protein
MPMINRNKAENKNPYERKFKSICRPLHCKLLIY